MNINVIKYSMKFDFLHLLDQLGLAWQSIINGVIGAAVWSIHKKTKFLTALRQMFIGGLVAGYATPFIANEWSFKAQGFLSFVIGTIGMVVVDELYKWAAKKIKILFN